MAAEACWPSLTWLGLRKLRLMLGQHLKRGFSLSPAPHHPARVHGCQEAAGDAGAHGPEGLQTTADTTLNPQIWPQNNHGVMNTKEGGRDYEGTFRRTGTSQVVSLTSSRLSPTSATSSSWPWRWRSMAAFSEAYMQVKSNMATSGWP
ncbi:hypothetical protein EYF80_040231 [Liparis tanakae]|uniref:Uncharacterized protein n=1 Tax=Liparis tanakae TaxID=230148 RepID=A0A4Z2G7K9_9TELE|nr:hypothetical protein EYF80_040231 [Liparis tanakae]